MVGSIVELVLGLGGIGWGGVGQGERGEKARCDVKQKRDDTKCQAVMVC